MGQSALNRVVDRYLLTLLGLVSLAGVFIFLPRHEGPAPALPVDSLPAQAEGWISFAGVPEKVLPIDPRAVDAVRRTYTKGSTTVWLTVAAYQRRNDPQRRPSGVSVVPDRGVGVVTHDRLRVDLNGVAESPTWLNRISFQSEGQPVSVVYWYELGRTIVTGEYELRLRLMRDTLLERPRSPVLVRVGTNSRERPEEFLRVLFPHLVNLSANL